MLARYFEAEYALSSIERRKLKVAHPAKLNDPFEFSLVPIGNLTLNQAIRILRDRVKEGDTDTLDNGIVVDLKRTREAFSDDRTLLQTASRMLEDPTSYSDMLREQAQRVGDATFRLICFTKPETKPEDEIRMWSLYANAHQGMRMHFEEASLTHCMDSTFHDVQYEDQRVTIKCGLIPDDPEYTSSLVSAITTKGKFWGYENERRFLIHTGDPSLVREKDLEFYKFPTNSLMRVDIGIEAKDKKEKLMQLLNKKSFKHVEIWETSLDDKDFKLHYDRIR